MIRAHQITSRPDAFGQNLARLSRSDPGWFCSIWSGPSEPNQTWEVRTGIYIIYLYTYDTIQPNSGCTRAVMAITKTLQNGSGMFTEITSCTWHWQPQLHVPSDAYNANEISHCNLGSKVISVQCWTHTHVIIIIMYANHIHVCIFTVIFSTVEAPNLIKIKRKTTFMRQLLPPLFWRNWPSQILLCPKRTGTSKGRDQNKT